MKPLSVPDLLAVWETGGTQPMVQWAITLLTAACPEETPEALALLPIGKRDGRLLTLYEWTFGTNLAGLAACPLCQEKLELSFQVDDIRVSPDNTDDLSVGELQMDGYEVHFRLPNSVDVTAVHTPEALLQRCITQVSQDGEEQPGTKLPTSVETAVISHMAQADPQADIQLTLTCPACQHTWQAPFDIITFFWHELHTWATRMLVEVHILASAYGWREADILGMTAGRRQFYLELIRNRQ